MVYDKELNLITDYSLENSESMIAGFFVTLFSLIIEYRKTLKNDEQWVLSQCKAFETITQTKEIKRIRVSEAKYQIKMMFESIRMRNTGKQDSLPLVFLDESQKTNDPNFKRDYKTLRKVI